MASRDEGGGGCSRLPYNRCERDVRAGVGEGHWISKRNEVFVSSGWGESICVRGDWGRGIMR